jgi:hypothetical protein
MSITRTTLLGGPAAATFNGHTFFAYDGILVTPALELKTVDSDSQGVLDETVSQGPVAIKFTPTAPFADLVALYPAATGGPGNSLFGAADAPLVLTAANGVRLTFAAVAVLQMPDLNLGTRGPVAGAVMFLALGARSIGLTTPNRLVTIDAATMPAAPSGTAELSDDYAITWGAAPWVNLRSRDGVRIRFVMTTKPVLSAANALLDVTLERLVVQVSFTPATPGGPAEADLVSALQLQGANARPGRALSATAAPLSITGEMLEVQFGPGECDGRAAGFRRDARAAGRVDIHGRAGVPERSGAAGDDGGRMKVKVKRQKFISSVTGFPFDFSFLNYANFSE